MTSNSNVTFRSHGIVAGRAGSIRPCFALGGRQQHQGLPLHDMRRGRGGADRRLQIERNAALQPNMNDVSDDLKPEKWQNSRSCWQGS